MQNNKSKVAIKELRSDFEFDEYCCDERNVNESIEFFKHVSSFKIFRYIQWKTFRHIFFTLKPLEHTTMDNKFINFESNDKHKI